MRYILLAFCYLSRLNNTPTPGSCTESGVDFFRGCLTLMRQPLILAFRGNLPVHADSVVLADIVGYLQNLDANGLCAELNLQLVACLHVIGRLGGPSVDRDAGAVAGLVGK